jgi:hypothetical protein
VGASFELGDPPPEISLLSLACGWPLGVNGSLLANGGASRALGLKILRVQGKGGRAPGVGQAGRLGPTGPGPSQPGSIGRPFPPVGPHVIMHFVPVDGEFPST